MILSTWITHSSPSKPNWSQAFPPSPIINPIKSLTHAELSQKPPSSPSPLKLNDKDPPGWNNKNHNSVIASIFHRFAFPPITPHPTPSFHQQQQQQQQQYLNIEWCNLIYHGEEEPGISLPTLSTDRFAPHHNGFLWLRWFFPSFILNFLPSFARVGKAGCKICFRIFSCVALLSPGVVFLLVILRNVTIEAFFQVQNYVEIERCYFETIIAGKLFYYFMIL